MTEHAPGSNPLWCANCGQDWPCDTARLPVPEQKRPDGSYRLDATKMHVPTAAKPLPKAPEKWFGYLLGMCGAMAAVDVICDRAAGHPLDTAQGQHHVAHDPSGNGRWVEFGPDGKIIIEAGPAPAPPENYRKAMLPGVLECTRCGSMVGDGPNPVARHDRFHASVDRHAAVIGETGTPVWR